MRIWMVNKAVSQKGIAALIGLTALAAIAGEADAQSYSSLITSNPNLVGYYHLDETTGATSAADSSGHGNSATITGTINFGQAGIPGAGGDKAYGFDGTGYARLPGSTISESVNGSSLEQGFTLEFWMNTSDASQRPGAPQWYNGDGLVDSEVSGITTDFGTSISGTHVLFGIGAGDITISSGTSLNVADGNWHLVDANWSTHAYNGETAGTMELYVDGMLVSSAAGPTDPRAAAAANGMAFGDLQTNANEIYNGDLDEIALYDQPLTAAQIQTHYSSGLNLTNNGAAPEPGVTSLMIAGFAPTFVGLWGRRRRCRNSR